MKQFEYSTIVWGSDAELSLIGQQGWQMVHHHGADWQGNGKLQGAIFMRELPSEAKEFEGG